MFRSGWFSGRYERRTHGYAPYFNGRLGVEDAHHWVTGTK